MYLKRHSTLSLGIYLYKCDHIILIFYHFFFFLSKQYGWKIFPCQDLRTSLILLSEPCDIAEHASDGVYLIILLLKDI